MKILICDDDKEIVYEINKNLNQFFNHKKIHITVSTFNDGDSVVEENQVYDMAFIDIELPGINGLQVAKQLKKINSNIILFIVTSFQGYLDDAMDLKIFRYLLKPIDKNRFIKSMETAFELYKQNTQNIVIDDSGSYFSVFTSEILYITIEKRKTKIITKSHTYLTNQPFDYWKQQLSKYKYFSQPHYSFIVNLNYVISFNKTEVKITDKQISIPISRRYYKDFKHDFFDYMGVNL